MKYKHHGILLLVFCAVFFSHFLSRNVTSFDSAWIVHTAMSLLKEGNTDLDEYAEMIQDQDPRIRRINGHLYTIYPVGTPLIAAPFVLMIDQALRLAFIHFPPAEERARDYIRGRSSRPPPEHISVITIYPGVELLIASFIISMTSVFIYLLTRLFLDVRRSLLAVFIFAFCTSSWSVASRGLWQHGPSMLMLTVALYLTLRAEERPWLIQWVGLPLAFSYVIRPSNGLSVFFLSVYILLRFRPYFLRYLLWAMIIVIPFFVFNLKTYHSLLSPYYLYPIQKIGFRSHAWEALAANLFSPGRGLFVFSPILLFSLLGINLKIRNRSFKLLDSLLLGTLFLHWIAISLNPIWWAGWSFGPRFFSDMIPYFVYFLIPVLAMAPSWEKKRNILFISVFFCFTLMSFFVHCRGATQWDAYAWNHDPVNVDVKPSRVWDWSDVQFLRGVK